MDKHLTAFSEHDRSLQTEVLQSLVTRDFQLIVMGMGLSLAMPYTNPRVSTMHALTSQRFCFKSTQG